MDIDNYHFLSEPLSFTVTKKYDVKSYSYNVLKYALNDYISLEINCFDNSNNFLKKIQFTLSGEIYNSWGNDDSYVLNYIDNSLPELFLDNSNESVSPISIPFYVLEKINPSPVIDIPSPPSVPYPTPINYNPLPTTPEDNTQVPTPVPVPTPEDNTQVPTPVPVPTPEDNAQVPTSVQSVTDDTGIVL